MTSFGEVGETNEAHDTKLVLWTIPAFSSLSTEVGKFYRSKSFSFADEEIHFRIFPGADREISKGYVSVFPVKKPSKTNSRIKWELGLKWADGSVESIISEEYFTFLPDGRGHGHSKFFHREELLRRLGSNNSSGQNDPALCDVLTLVFTLRRGDPIPLVSPETQGTCMELEKLSEDFEDLLTEEKSCDVTLIVKGMEFRAHKTILIARSPVFAAMFEHDMIEKDTGIIDIPDCDENSFDAFLEYLYSGKVVNVSFSYALELYRTAHKYDVPKLKSFCAKYLSKNLTVDGVPCAVALADQYDEEELLSAVQDFFNGHVGEIVVTKEWESLNKRDFRLANKLIVGASSYFSTLQQIHKAH